MAWCDNWYALPTAPLLVDYVGPLSLILEDEE